ncbi:hypothetical protein [Roseomonas sp. CECT 9278]|uniref:hypothetical protein n=1 Tax=Roseomonas sp. CECT 9278 TaxID=2845823 RepID=UPI001E64D3C5|nr:hypothetical protein [Roseomonas sp. CECT 9278]CAH0223738.1 hypothetical protein ROS9278_02473 [Roseomonas sp. CECT 9278]
MGTFGITLVLAAGPGSADGHPARRYEIDLALDAAGRPDAAAWAADPRPWRARRIDPGAEPLQGDVQHDPDHGWSIRFFGTASEGPDAPETHFDCGPDPVRPGEYATVVEPDGAAFSYRVVAVG